MSLTVRYPKREAKCYRLFLFEIVWVDEWWRGWWNVNKKILQRKKNQVWIARTSLYLSKSNKIKHKIDQWVISHRSKWQFRQFAWYRKCLRNTGQGGSIQNSAPPESCFTFTQLVGYRSSFFSHQLFKENILFLKYWIFF